MYAGYLRIFEAVKSRSCMNKYSINSGEINTIKT